MRITTARVLSASASEVEVSQGEPTVRNTSHSTSHQHTKCQPYYAPNMKFLR